jgi:uncharacterized DUF497 family protein
MIVEFNAAKNAANLRRHGIGLVRFLDLEIDTAVSEEERRRDYGERRFRVLGFIDGWLHAAAITHRGEKIRVISLRRANRHEEKSYAKERGWPS